MRRLTPKQVREAIASSRSILAVLEADIEGLFTRTEYASRDGYPAGSFATSSHHAGLSDPTALRAIDPMQADPVARHSAAALLGIIDVAKRLETANGKRDLAMRVEVEHRGRVNSTKCCEACLEAISEVEGDRSRRGFCNSCYTAWRRYVAAENDKGNDASSIVFIEKRRIQLNSLDVVVV